MDDWDLDELWDWSEEDDEDMLYDRAGALAGTYFLSDKDLLPSSGEAYSLGHVEAGQWIPLVKQLDAISDLETVVILSEALDDLLNLLGLPTELLETPLGFLQCVLEGNLPREPSGRRVDSRRLVKISLLVIRLAQVFPENAQAAMRAWADLHRMMGRFNDLDDYDEEVDDFPLDRDLPPPVTGFSMLIAMTLMRWPDRAEGVPLPPGFLDLDLYADMLTDWENLPDSLGVTGDGAGHAEALFAQGQLAYVLAELGTVEGLDPDPVGDDQEALVYSRLSRAILWLHNQCRGCPEREAIACRAVAMGGSGPPTPLLDVASLMANEGRISGCVRV